MLQFYGYEPYKAQIWVRHWASGMPITIRELLVVFAREMENAIKVNFILYQIYIRHA